MLYDGAFRYGAWRARAALLGATCMSAAPYGRGREAVQGYRSMVPCCLADMCRLVQGGHEVRFVCHVLNAAVQPHMQVAASLRYPHAALTRILMPPAGDTQGNAGNVQQRVLVRQVGREGLHVAASSRPCCTACTQCVRDRSSRAPRVPLPGRAARPYVSPLRQA